MIEYNTQYGYKTEEIDPGNKLFFIHRAKNRIDDRYDDGKTKEEDECVKIAKDHILASFMCHRLERDSFDVPLYTVRLVFWDMLHLHANTK